MKIEHKTLPLSQFKALEDGNGGFAGYPSDFNVLDETGDIVLPGAYAKCLDTFLQRGYISKGHDSNANVGYPTVAKEDDRGLYSEMAFHSTPDAQVERIKTAERIQAGKTASLSIGFSAKKSKTIPAADYKAQLPLYVKDATALGAIMEKSGKFNEIRLLEEIELFEFSLVGIPALRSAAVTQVKTVETKGDYLGDNIEEMASMAVLSRLNDRLMYSCFYDCLCSYGDNGMTAEEQMAMVEGGLAEFVAAATRIVGAILRSEPKAESVDAATKSLHALWCDPETKDYAASREGLAFTKELDTVLAAVEKSHRRAVEIKALRESEGRKAGRRLSAASREKLQAVRDELDALMAEEGQGGESTPEVAEPGKADPAEVLRAMARFRVAQARFDGHLAPTG